MSFSEPFCNLMSCVWEKFSENNPFFVKISFSTCLNYLLQFGWCHKLFLRDYSEKKHSKMSFSEFLSKVSVKQWNTYFWYIAVAHVARFSKNYFCKLCTDPIMLTFITLKYPNKLSTFLQIFPWHFVLKHAGTVCNKHRKVVINTTGCRSWNYPILWRTKFGEKKPFQLPPFSCIKFSDNKNVK